MAQEKINLARDSAGHWEDKDWQGGQGLFISAVIADSQEKGGYYQGRY